MTGTQTHKREMRLIIRSKSGWGDRNPGRWTEDGRNRKREILRKIEADTAREKQKHMGDDKKPMDRDGGREGGQAK